MSVPPQVPPSPKRRRTWVVVAAVAAAVVVVAGATAAVTTGGRHTVSASVRHASPSGVASSASRPRYEITLPKALDGGRYTLARDDSSQLTKAVGTSGHTWRSGQYTAADGTVLQVTGAYGEVNTDPAHDRAQLLSGSANAPDTAVTVKPSDFTVAGAATTFTCQVVAFSKNGRRTAFPECAWADADTWGTVLETTPGSPAALPLRKMADLTAEIRDEVRVSS
ncbi:hypothetical protein K7472_15235 [Streptomyces sp. PTM05]|uniref:Uncharacterized protein n=1 Tax=Streptantibioticus parmotrematis TaxID=2873249 RepID=A0ABS7QSP2_9ACTN|nr:hypothetical protein [Streptantibioticus parmotrematis]MBY8886205.1 hypothetical protein [Streptantibioticus parmotrematis]